MKIRSKHAVKAVFTDTFGIPREILWDEPRVLLEGNARLTVENHSGVIEYTRECVRLKTSTGALRVEGSDMVLCELSSTFVTIIGVIGGFCFVK